MSDDQRFNSRPVRQLRHVIDRLEAVESQARVRQLRMVEHMWDRGIATDDVLAEVVGDSLADLFDPAAVERFWELAVAGELRRWESTRGTPLPLSSQRTVRDCLKLLAWAARQRVALPLLVRAEAKDTVQPRHVRRLYRELVDLAGRGPLESGRAALSLLDRTRLLALVAMVLDTGARSGELEKQRTGDLGDGLGWARVVRAPQNAHHEEGEGPVVEQYALREGSRVAIRRWLVMRDDLVAGLEGSRDGLWVSIRPSKAGPEGIPLRAQGIRMAYARGMGTLNDVMAGQQGWKPMPLNLEQLRRSLTVAPAEVEEPADG